MIYIIGIVITFFLDFLLISKKNKTTADKILAAWLFVIGAHLSLYYAYSTNIAINFPYLLGIGIPIPLLHGPFLYLYTVFITTQLRIKKPLYFLHFLLPTSMYVYLIPFFLSSNEHKIYVFQNEGVGYELFMTILNVLINVSGVVYVILSLIILKKHRQTILNQFSDIEKINFNWLQILIYGMSITWLVVLSALPDSLLFGFVTVFVLFLGYFGIKQVGVFSNNPPPPDSFGMFHQSVAINQGFEKKSDEPIETEVVEIEEIIKKKYQKSGLSEKQAEQVQETLSKLMKTEKLFKNSELTLADLAQKLNIHPNYLSQVINEKEGVNFYDYVNNLRIEEFKKIATLPENKQYTLLSLAFDCGFNSKSSFNRYFKKAMDLSPSEYMNSLL